MPRTLLIRTDAAPRIGYGHAMRCLALAQTARDYGMNVVFVMKESADFVEKRLNAEGCQIAHIKNEADLDSFDGDHIVVDGYQFDAGYQDNLKQRGRRVLFIDDFGHCDRYTSDLVLNQNIYANESFYKNISENTVLLLGPKYVLLRREFQNSIPLRSTSPIGGGQGGGRRERESKNILITLGGFDQHHFTEKVQSALKNIDADIRIARNTADMPALMEWADIAVTAAGTTVYELAYMGTPMAMIVLAENQKRVAEGMEKAGFGINLGWHEHVTADAIRNVVKKSPLPLPAFAKASAGKKGEGKGEGWGPIDGYGAPRVLSHLFEWPLWLRPATKEDSGLLFDWANDPSIRAVSFSPKPILWKDHQQWFQNKLQDPNCRIFMGMDWSDLPIGQIRFDRCDAATEIDISVAASARGKGYATSLINIGVQRLFATSDIVEVHALIKKDNLASLHAFQKAGFKNAGEDTVKNTPVFRYYVKR